MSRILLAMSGGVDSSVAAMLLTKAGHDVVGAFMKHGSEIETCDSTSTQSALPIVTRSDHKQGCCSASDAEDGRQVADRLGIPFYALNLQEDFDRIIDYFVDEYSSGRTPNPCVRCNNWLKFGRLFGYADSIGAEFVATGHYAQLGNAESPTLRRGADKDKDQSYVLFGVKRERLARMMLPIGGFKKSQIRQMAEEFGLNVHDKKDSQEICFVTSGKHQEFVAAHKGEQLKRGKFVTTDGTVVGEHVGIERYTIGQRKGLGVAMGEPYFVVRIDVEQNQVVIGKKEELARTELSAGEANWLVDPPNGAMKCHAQIRYNSSAVPAILHTQGDDRFRVVFDEPCYGVAPGQAVVIYDDDQVLGGGWIE